MTTRPTVSIAQLDVLEAAAAGKLSRSDTDYDLGTWRIDGDGPAVTGSATSLLKRGLIEESPPCDLDGRLPAYPTEAGHALLAELASREPARKDPDADPS